MQYTTEIAICLALFVLNILLIYGILKSFDKSNQQQLNLLKNKIEAGQKTESNYDNTLLSLRLQAYERMTLFLERIHPNNLIPRLSISGQNTATFQSALLRVIREEYEHNLSQQLYVSDLAWEACKTAKENIIQLIIQSASALNPKDEASKLANEILTAGIKKENDPIEQALKLLKREIRQQP